MKDNKKYQVESVTYVKVPTKERYPNDYPIKGIRGKTKYDSTKKSQEVLNTTWGKIKKDAYKESQSNENVYVGWKTHIQKIVRTHPNGVKEVTYFNPVRGE